MTNHDRVTFAILLLIAAIVLCIAARLFVLV